MPVWGTGLARTTSHSIHDLAFEVTKIATEVVSPRGYGRRRISTKHFLTAETYIFVLSYVVLISGFYLLGGTEDEAKLGGKIGSIETKQSILSPADARRPRRAASHCR